MNEFLDLLLTILHILLVAFNLFGWIFRSTRKWHLFTIGLTAFCWLILGIWYGFGYCPLTDWQWKIKSQLGERNLPNSFITYMANKITHGSFMDENVNVVTGVCFVVVFILSVYVNIIPADTADKNRRWRR